jgi:RNA polymerase sigma-70 factor (ECF subfamily)
LSWDKFYRTYERAVRSLARKRGLTDAEAEEVAQEVFKRIAETIHSFEPTSRAGSFRRWLFQLARWRSDDKIRERGRVSFEPMGDHTTSGSKRFAHRIAAPDDIEEALETDARRQLMQVALERLKQRINPRDLQVFQHLVVEEWPVEKVASFFGIRSALIYVIRHRVGRQLRLELERIQKRLSRGAIGPGPSSDA